MTIGIHNQPAGPTPGGSEYCVAILAEALARYAPVEVVHHRPTMTRAVLEETSGADLGSVQMRCVPTEMELVARGLRPWRLHRELAEWARSLSEPYDLFITFTHDVPPRCYARAGVFVVLFPMFAVPPGPPPWRPLRFAADPKGNLQRLYWNWRFRERVRSYRAGVAISAYTNRWTNRLWGTDCRVIAPPVDTAFDPAPKGNAILSVGRFATQGHRKKQLEMVTAFRRLVDGGLAGWEYHSVGGLGNSPKDQDFFQEVVRGAAGYPAHVAANMERPRLRDLFARAKVFWHAAGYGDDPDAHPELSEHFGISTVEAMAAGCVPVVINQGAQPELVEHGVTGFLWNTLDELVEHTTRLIHDGALCARMSAAACERSRAYSREAFVAAYLDLLRPLLPPAAPAGRGVP
jgi:glycosyltransferase involved in cell wall biosynthesis